MVEVPNSCEWRSGTSPILLVAPHGGRRPPVDACAPPPHLRVNDLYTPEITRILADRLAAATIINHGLDRNVLDLNRTSQVRRHASWFLDLLVEQIGDILQRHAHAEVLFVHGWNTGQPKCDIGIGAIEVAGELRVPDGGLMTVSTAYLHARIAALRAACNAAQIASFIGEKYPASHRNNVLQLFTARGEGSDDPRARQIAAWVTDGRLTALQLELGIPLRWPGAWRDRFIDAMVRAFQGASGAAPARPSVVRPVALAGTATSLQFYDAATDVGMFAGVGRVGPHAVGGRVLLFLGGQRIALFTGEDLHGPDGRVTPLAVDYESGVLQLRFSGPILLLDDAAVYLDLEAALGASRMEHADVAVRFEQTRQAPGVTRAEFGVVQGEIAIGARRVRVDTGGFANAGGFRASGLEQQTMLTADFGGGRGLLSRVAGGDAGSLALWFTRDATHALHGARVAVTTDGDVYTPASFDFTCANAPPVHGQPLSRMAILRPGGAGYLRVTFGVARFVSDGEIGYGLYEHARPLEMAVK